MMTHSLYPLSKRTFDIASSSIGLLLFSPILFFIGFAIKLSSRGPVIFQQHRVGKNGVNFTIFKFRTMKFSSHPSLPVTIKNDKRITLVGRFLRASKLDELPQLLNVLIGNMSMVGPRPEIPEIISFYTPEQHKLLSVKPGITSPATIYHRDEEEVIESPENAFEYHTQKLMPKKAAFDLAYIVKASFWYDIKIILLTIVSVLTNQSGYMRKKALKNRRLIIFLAHVFISAFAYYISFLFRFDADIPPHEFVRFQRTIPLFLFVQIVFLSLFGLSHGYWKYVGIDEVKNIGSAVLLSTTSLFIIESLFLDVSYPTGVILVDGIVSFILFSGIRFSTRFLREAYYPLSPVSKEHILLLGAGDKTESLIRDIHHDPDLGINIVGIIDLDPNLRGHKIHGVKVLGTLDSLKGILREVEVNNIINTYSNLSREDTLKISTITSKFNIKIKSIPSLTEVISGKLNLNKFRELRYEDLLGREEVHLNWDLLEKIYHQKRILISGAGGSIGSELVRQISRFKPKDLYLLDKDESLLYEIQIEMQESMPEINIHTLIGDIRDKAKLNLYFEKYKPEIVLHSAAYKHVPLLEEHPQEAYQNNVLGTRNLLQISEKFYVKRFVMISTDKAVKPTNVMGATKALSERLMFDIFAKHAKMKCMAVRFGNVLGSRGSVIPIFKRQIENGGPIRITHENITRYFMSIPEAAQLVLQAGAMGNGREIFILKMGDPVKIKDLAYRMIEHAGYIPNIDIKVEYTGLRHGEKMYEELLTDIENSQATEHEKIYVIKYKDSHHPLQLKLIDDFEKNICTRTNKEVRTFLEKQVADYSPKNPIN